MIEHTRMRNAKMVNRVHKLHLSQFYSISNPGYRDFMHTITIHKFP